LPIKEIVIVSDSRTQSTILHLILRVKKMMLKAVLFSFAFAFAGSALAEGSCPPGQYPIGGQGVAACAPIPQAGAPARQESRPTGKWIKTWGAIALGTVDATPYYGVPTGLGSESEAKQQALARCAKFGAKNCRVVLAYENQCAAIGEPQTDGKPSPDGFTQFVGQPSKEKAAGDAMDRCQQRNPGMQCKVIYNACSEPVFQRF
jgi:hypothetical protein